MILTIERQPLLAALTRAVAVIPPKTISALLSHVHIKAESDGLVIFRATNLDIETTVRTEALVSGPGEITVEANRLLQIVRNTELGADFQVQIEESRLLVKTGRSRFRLPTLPADSFPSFSDPAWEASLDIDPGTLSDMIERTRFAMADERNPAYHFLAGVHFAIVGKELHAFATQRQQMAFIKVGIEGEYSLPQGVTIPKALLSEMTALCASSKEPVRLNLMSGRAGIATQNATIVGKAVDGSYVDYLAMAARMENQPHKLQADRVQLIGSVRRIASIMSEIERGVRIDIPENGDAISLSGHGADGADSTDMVEAEITGAECVLGVNADVMIPVLEALTGDIVVIEYKDREGPIRFTSPDNPESVMFMAQRKVA